MQCCPSFSRTNEENLKKKKKNAWKVRSRVTSRGIEEIEQIKE